jgi:hypothetical protein
MTSDALLARDYDALTQKLADCDKRIAEAAADPDQAWKRADLDYERDTLLTKQFNARAARYRLTGEL